MKREKKKESYSIVFRSRIKELRGNETQEQFAGSLGVSLDAVKNWEQGYAMPGIDTLFKLCDKYHCEIDYLLGRMEHKTHDLQYICDETGLSERAVEVLKYHAADSKIAANLCQIVDVLLTSDDTEKIADTINNAYCLYKEGFKDIESFDIHTDYATELFSTEAMKSTLLRDAMDMFRNDLNDLFNYLIQDWLERKSDSAGAGPA